MEQSLLKTLSVNTYNLTDLKRRVRLLKDYVNNSLFSNSNFSTEEISSADKHWLAKLPPELFNQFNTKNANDIFNNLQAEIEKLSPLIIYLSIVPTEEQIENIGIWLRKNIQQDIFFDTKFDPNLIAGCAFVWNGVYKDFSLRARINQNREEILTTIKQSLPKYHHLEGAKN